MRLTRDRINGTREHDVKSIGRITKLAIANLQDISDDLNHNDTELVESMVLRLVDVMDGLLYLVDDIEKAYDMMGPHTKDRLGGSLYARIVYNPGGNRPKPEHGSVKIELLESIKANGGVSCANVDVGFDMRRDGAPVFVHPNTRSAIYDHPLGGLAKVTGTASEIALVLLGAGYDVDTRHASGGSGDGS